MNDPRTATCRLPDGRAIDGRLKVIADDGNGRKQVVVVVLADPNTFAA